MHLYIIDFSNQSNWVPVFPPAIVLREAPKDGGQAYKDSEAWPPDLVIVNMESKPSHGLQTAISTHQQKTTALVPIWFVQTPVPCFEKIKGVGQVVEPESLLSRISNLLSV
jgi:hypothetical protein